MSNYIIAECDLKSASPYSQGKFINEKKDRDETHEQFEERTWWKRCHLNADGNVIIPPMQFKNCLAAAAKYKSIQIPGKGKATYTKHFEAGVLVLEPLVLPEKIILNGDGMPKQNDVHGEPRHLPSDGTRGGAKRVMKIMPEIPSWEGTVSFHIFDLTIDEETFKTHLIDAGQFIGVGVFRPRNNGYFGRFSVEEVRWIQS